MRSSLLRVNCRFMVCRPIIVSSHLHWVNLKIGFNRCTTGTPKRCIYIPNHRRATVVSSNHRVIVVNRTEVRIATTFIVSPPYNHLTREMCMSVCATRWYLRIPSMRYLCESHIHIGNYCLCEKYRRNCFKWREMGGSSPPSLPTISIIIPRFARYSHSTTRQIALFLSLSHSLRTFLCMCEWVAFVCWVVVRRLCSGRCLTWICVCGYECCDQLVAEHFVEHLGHEPINSQWLMAHHMCSLCHSLNNTLCSI